MSSFENRFALTSRSLRGANTAMRTGKSTPMGLPFTHLRHQNNEQAPNDGGAAKRETTEESLKIGFTATQ